MGLRFFSAMFFSAVVAVNLVYQATVVGLNPLQLVLVGTLLGHGGGIKSLATCVSGNAFGILHFCF